MLPYYLHWDLNLDLEPMPMINDTVAYCRHLVGNITYCRPKANVGYKFIPRLVVIFNQDVDVT